MRKAIYIICVAALALVAASCSPKATADGVEPNGDTVEVIPTSNAPTQIQNTDTINPKI